MTQRVLITAAAAGIGRAIADAFADSGAQVRVCDIDAAAVERCRTERPELGATRVDVADADALAAWFNAAVHDLGGLDVLVNNAGIKGPTAFVEDVSPEEWRQCMAVCLDSHYLTSRLAAPILKAQGSGSIINLSSMAGVVGYGMRSPYAAAKWGVVGLTKSLAIELGPSGVTCNAICPGSVAGDRMERVAAAEAAQRGTTVEAVHAEYLAGQSIKRYVEPTEIAGLCLFLASPAGSMISGQALAIDGNTETYRLG